MNGRIWTARAVGEHRDLCPTLYTTAGQYVRFHRIQSPVTFSGSKAGSFTTEIGSAGVGWRSGDAMHWQNSFIMVTACQVSFTGRQTKTRIIQYASFSPSYCNAISSTCSMMLISSGLLGQVIKSRLRTWNRRLIDSMLFKTASSRCRGHHRSDSILLVVSNSELRD
jgi:hypothetical protein